MESQLAQDIKESAMKDGVDFFGIADLEPVREKVEAQGGESLAEFTRAVAIGMALPDETDKLIMRHDDVRAIRQYKRIYDETNQKLDIIAASLAGRMKTAGVKALAVHASRRTDHARLYGLFSHKMAAHLAGLGWIGKSCLLINPVKGPRVRWVTVLTASLLPAGGGPTEEACGKCRRCVDICPAGAFTGAAFLPEQSRSARFAAKKCENYVTVMRTKMGCDVLCGLCIAVCPHGKQSAKISAFT